MLIGFILLLIFYKALHLKFHLLIGLFILGLLHSFGGTFIINGLPLYQGSITTIPYDKIVHFFGSFIVALIAYNFIYPALIKKEQKNKGFVFLTVFLITVGVGAIIEIIEFIATISFQKTIVGDYQNNILDLVANALGAIFASLFYLKHYKKFQ
jgi:uncharacterized membrane protein YjdF